MGFFTAASAFCVVGGADIIFPLRVRRFAPDGRQAAAAVLAEKTAPKRAGRSGFDRSGAAPVSAAAPFSLQLLHQGKIGLLNDGRMMLFKNVLFTVRHAPVPAVDGGSGPFAQSEGTGIKIIFQKLPHHALGPGFGDGSFGYAPRGQLPGMLCHGRGWNVLIGQIDGDFAVTETGKIESKNLPDVRRLLRNDFQKMVVCRVSAVSEGRPGDQRPFLLPGGEGPPDFFAGVFYIALIEPCFDPDGIVAGILRVIIIVDDNQTLSAFLKFIQKQKNLGVVPAKPGKILDVYRVNVLIQILHEPSEARSVKQIAGNAVVLIPPVDDNAPVRRELPDNQLLIFDGHVIAPVVVSGKTDISRVHDASFSMGLKGSFMKRFASGGF